MVSCLRFKLYLYGIEMRNNGSTILRNRVQIVPLWNWNTARRLLNEMCYWVQIVPLWNWNDATAYADDNRWRVQIVPLWNWNNDDIIRNIQYGVFKLYLYGIEMKYKEIQLANDVVQIVPLWNWNSIFFICPSFNSCSNCTFMELKYNILLKNNIKEHKFKLYLYGIEIHLI